MKKWHTRGFTLTEIMVVVGIIGILSALVYGNLRTSGPIARDAERKGDLRAMQVALENYKQKYGYYPSGCNGSTTVYNNIVWSGEYGGTYQCGSSREYIIGLAPEFIPTLPTDPKPDGNPGYVYAVNRSGTVYKLMAMDTVETETVDKDHDFFRCGNDFKYGFGSGDTWEDPGMCVRVPSTYGSGGSAPTPAPCQDNNVGNRSTYAVTGGYSTDTWAQPDSRKNKAREYDTEIVRCF